MHWESLLLQTLKVRGKQSLLPRSSAPVNNYPDCRRSTSDAPSGANSLRRHAMVAIFAFEVADSHILRNLVQRLELQHEPAASMRDRQRSRSLAPHSVSVAE